MSDPRPAPPRLRGQLRALGGRAGWTGVAIQLAVAVVLLWIAAEIIGNARANLQAQRIVSGFGFLWNTAGFAVSQSLIPYSESDSFARVFVVGLLNTLLVSGIGIVFATILGFLVGLGRLSPNWLLARICGAYVEIVRNLPLLFQILFWYLAVVASLPGPRQSLSLGGFAFLNNRALVVPMPVPQPGFAAVAAALVVAMGLAIGLHRIARARRLNEGRVLTVWPFSLALLAGLPLAAALVAGAPLALDWPALRGFNFAGGLSLKSEFVALVLALSIYTAAFIAEIVRAGVLAVNRGQMEAGASLGLSRAATLRLIVVPQALRVILPPLTNQYLNLTKNSSLGVAIGYPDLVSVFTSTTLSLTGQAIEIVAITMAVYLVLSLLTSAAMALYGRRINRSLGAA
jgi:general L-amino acid transport system permease protein